MMVTVMIDVLNRRYTIDATNDEMVGRWLRELVEEGILDPGGGNFYGIRVFLEVPR